MTTEEQDKLIAERLAERQRKLSIIASCERSESRMSWVRASGFLLAACLVGVVFVLQVNIHDDEPVRAAETEMSDTQRDSLLKVLESREQTEEVKYEIEVLKSRK